MPSKSLSWVCAILVAFSSATWAQTVPDPPAVISPLRVEPDRNGVNLTTGRMTIDGPTLGVPAAPRLHFDKVQNSAPYMRGTIVSGGGDGTANASFSVHSDGVSSESFKCPDFDCASLTYSGSTFTATGNDHQNGHYRRAGSGEMYNFTLTSADSLAGSTRTVQAYAASINYPDGETISFTYDSASCGLGTCYRPNRIETNVGYFITVSYQSSDINQMGWGVPLQATLYATANPATPLQQLTYNSDATTATDIGGRVWHLSGNDNELGLQVETSSGTVELPTEAPNAVTVSVAANAPLVGSFVRDGVTWTYAYTNPQANPNSSDYYYSNITVSGPNGYSMSYAMDPGYQNIFNGFRNVIQTSTDALGRQTNYAYDAGMRLTTLTLPEGNYVSIGYDNCGNIVSKTSTAKPGSGLANLTDSLAYPSDMDCTLNGVLQYRPNSYTDALNRVTSYSWNSDGQLTKELAPADQNSNQRLTYITYATSGAGISRKSLVQICKSSSSSIATAACSGNALSHTEYTYVGDTNLPATVTQKDEATGETRTTTYGYDGGGRATKIDGPLSGTGDAQYFQYDVYGRKIWEVGELGPNNLRLAKKYTYRDSDDRVTNVQSGTVSCTTACDTASLTLTLLQQTDTTYDSRRNPIREQTYKGTTVYSVTDRSFLDRGLADCSTVRMNLAALPAATATGACSLGTQGAQGPDRITKNIYDNAGQLLTVQKAYGTSLQQNYASYTYTNNGKQQTVTDANGNMAQYVYDGFDRLSQWQFPSPTSPGTVNTADYEQYAYDAAGNRTCLRKRDGSKLTYAFDALNRMTSKVVAATSGGSCP